jgi:ribosomal protein L16 Arg81 hydroxylase
VLFRSGLAPLRADLGLLPGLVGDGHPRAWVGPAGTVTPTHTDQSCGWFAQLVGRKRLFLASPLEPALIDAAYGLFAQVDPRGPRDGALAEVRWHEVVLAPGDALFTPVGWWHHVEALEPSFSVSFSGFRWPNAFPWFVPG